MSAVRNIHRWNSRAPRREFWWVFLGLVGGVSLFAYLDTAASLIEIRELYIFQMLCDFSRLLTLTVSLTVVNNHLTVLGKSICGIKIFSNVTKNNYFISCTVILYERDGT